MKKKKKRVYRLVEEALIRNSHNRGFGFVLASVRKAVNCDVQI